MFRPCLFCVFVGARREFSDTGVCVRLAGIVCMSVRHAPTDDLKETWFGLNASLTYICKQARHGTCTAN